MVRDRPHESKTNSVAVISKIVPGEKTLDNSYTSNGVGLINTLVYCKGLTVWRKSETTSTYVGVDYSVTGYS